MSWEDDTVQSFTHQSNVQQVFAGIYVEKNGVENLGWLVNQTAEA